MYSSLSLAPHSYLESQKMWWTVNRLVPWKEKQYIWGIQKVWLLKRMENDAQKNILKIPFNPPKTFYFLGVWTSPKIVQKWIFWKYPHKYAIHKKVTSDKIYFSQNFLARSIFEFCLDPSKWPKTLKNLSQFFQILHNLYNNYLIMQFTAKLQRRWIISHKISYWIKVLL